MRIDNYGQMVFGEKDLCDIYFTNPETKLKNVLVDSSIVFNDVLSIDNVPELINYQNTNKTVKEFDADCQNQWFLPEEYLNMDIAQWVLDQCKSDAELQRAGKELLMYQERNMFTFLKYLKYLVDTMRKNNIVWGVGRGSSVSSFVLFILGVHRINSLYFDLDIEEFLK